MPRRWIRPSAQIPGDPPGWPAVAGQGRAAGPGRMIVLAPPRAGRAPANCMARNWRAFWRSHQVPLRRPNKDPEQLQMLETWLRAYRPRRNCSIGRRHLDRELQAFRPRGSRRMGSMPACQWRPAARKLAPATDRGLCGWRVEATRPERARETPTRSVNCCATPSVRNPRD